MSGTRLDRLAAKLPGLEEAMRAVSHSVAGVGPLANDNSLALAAIRCLGESIAEASRVGPRAWGLTVLQVKNLARLNVGKVEMFNFSGTGAHSVMCLRTGLPSRRSIERLGGFVHPSLHKSVPRAVFVGFPERSFARGFRMVRESHFAAVAVASRHDFYAWPRSHSPEAVRRVREVSDIHLPDPLYAKDSRSSFLLTWNPDTELDGFTGFRRPGQTGVWRCWSKAPTPGDRLFWLRQGGAVRSRGIFASGIVTERRRSDGQIEYRIEKRVDPVPGTILPLQELEKGAPGASWRTQRSGVGIASEDSRIIGEMWRAFLARDDTWDEVDEPEALEGQVRRQDVLRRARDLGLRSAKLSSVLQSSGRLSCEVPGCGFDFHAVYGELGRHFAIVHHEIPLGTRKRAKRTRLSELRIVCANCHMMIHRNGETRKLAAINVRRG